MFQIKLFNNLMLFITVHVKFFINVVSQDTSSPIVMFANIEIYTRMKQSFAGFNQMSNLK